MIRVAVIGTQGVPANYGGFESLVENIIGENCSPDVQYTVFCSSKDMGRTAKDSGKTGSDSLALPREYKGARLRYVPLHANGMQSIPYDILSMLRSLRGYDVLLILGVSGCLFMPALRMLARKKRLIVNIDGLEHRRDKWGATAKRVLRTSEALAVRYADVVVADNKGIADYVRDTYGREAVMIAYGGDHVRRNVPEERQARILESYGVVPQQYGITVCRIEPENNCHVTLEAFAEVGKPLIFIGNWRHSEYARSLHAKYCDTPGMTLVDSEYDLDRLYTLRSNAEVYVHGHSAGGTNPSLVEAMFIGRPVIAYDCVYNRETMHGLGRYFKDAASLARLLTEEPESGEPLRRLAEREYTWRHIAECYEKIFKN